VLIRAEQPGDEAAVADLVTAAFGDRGEVAALVVALRPLARGGGASLVAEDAGGVVGHTMLTRSVLDAPPRLVDVLVLSPLAVRPDRQGEGIGGTLVRRTLEEATRLGSPAVFLEGSPVYYGRFGFVAGGEHGFRKPSLRIPDAGFQVALLPAYERWMTGTLVYAHEFWDADAVGLREPGG
jgi:putative acetyltransferase